MNNYEQFQNEFRKIYRKFDEILLLLRGKFILIFHEIGENIL